MSMEVEREAAFSQLKLLREKSGFDSVPFFSDENLQRVLDSLEGYTKARTEASPVVQELLTSQEFVNSLIGIFPENLLGLEKWSGKVELPYGIQKNVTTLKGSYKQELQELQYLLEKHLPFLHTLKTYRGDIFEKGRTHLINTHALDAVFTQNSDLFPQDSDPLEWLGTHQSEWSAWASPARFTPANIKKMHSIDLKYGVVSGFPREDCEIFSKEYGPGPFSDLFVAVKNFFLGKKRPPPPQDHPAEDLAALQDKTQFQFRVFTETGYIWLKAAGALLEQLHSFGFFPQQPSHPLESGPEQSSVLV